MLSFLSNSGSRRWIAAAVLAFVIHSVCLFLLARPRLQSIKSPSPAGAIVLRLLPPSGMHASSSHNVHPSPTLEELSLFAEPLHKREIVQEKKITSFAEPKPLDAAKRAPPKAIATVKRKEGAVSSPASKFFPPSEMGAPTNAGDSALLANIEKSQETDTGSLTSREETPLSGVLTRAEDVPLPISQTSEPPVPISQIAPSYPERARALGIQGLVRLEAILNREGRVEQDIKVLESIPFLDEAASTALRQWRFKPARDQSGQPVRVIVEVPFRFALKQ